MEINYQKQDCNLDWRIIRLSSGTHARNRKTDIDGRTHTTEEKFGFQEDLTISDGNNL